jgi:hypothetical protein
VDDSVQTISIAAEGAGVEEGNFPKFQLSLEQEPAKSQVSDRPFLDVRAFTRRGSVFRPKQVGSGEDNG